MFDPYTSRSARVVCLEAIKQKMVDKTARQVMRDKYMGPIRVEIFKRQENLLKSATKFMVK